MQTMLIDVPDDVLAITKMDTDEMRQDMTTDYACSLFENGRITLMQGAHFCQKNIYDFMAILKKRNIPVINYPPEQLEEEMKRYKQQC
jgi:predicted HTH domain antitoxin